MVSYSIILYHKSSVKVCNRQCHATLDQPLAKAANTKNAVRRGILSLTGLLPTGVSCWTEGGMCYKTTSSV